MVSLDRALLERVITGDEAALTELVRLFFTEPVSLCEVTGSGS